MSHVISPMFNGLGAAGIALSVNRLALGAFFSISGAHKLLSPPRHAAIAHTLRTNHIPAPYLMEWVVPIFEFGCGLSLVAGLLSPLASLALFTICLVATCTEGRNRIASYKPLDRADRLDDYLYLPEVLYMLGLFLVMVAGPGTLSLDHYLAALLS